MSFEAGARELKALRMAQVLVDLHVDPDIACRMKDAEWELVEQAARVKKSSPASRRRAIEITAVRLCSPPAVAAPYSSGRP